MTLRQGKVTLLDDWFRCQALNAHFVFVIPTMTGTLSNQLWQIGPIIAGPKLRVGIFLLEPDRHLWHPTTGGPQVFHHPLWQLWGPLTARSIAHGRRTSTA